MAAPQGNSLHSANADPERWKKLILDPLDGLVREAEAQEPGLAKMRALAAKLLLGIAELREEGWA